MELQPSFLDSIPAIMDELRAENAPEVLDSVAVAKLLDITQRHATRLMKTWPVAHRKGWWVTRQDLVTVLAEVLEKFGGVRVLERVDLLSGKGIEAAPLSVEAAELVDRPRVSEPGQGIEIIPGQGVLVRCRTTQEFAITAMHFAERCMSDKDFRLDREDELYGKTARSEAKR